jgi:hypothetical protein
LATTNTKKNTPKSEDALVEKTIMQFQEAYKFQSKNIKHVIEDYKFYLSKQWTDQAQADSESNGQGRLTQVNNIRPYIHLVEGYQRQNRNDIIAYPEGDEDSLEAEVVTRLIKNTMKLSKGDFKVSDLFKHGSIGGSAYFRPYMDYSKNLIYGELKFKLLTGLKVFYDPAGEEYDLSDCRYVCLFKQNMSAEDIKTLFPDFNVDKIEFGRIAVSEYGNQRDETVPYTKYYFKNNIPTNEDSTWQEKPYTYDMLEYYYKKHRNKYFLINLENNGVIEGLEKELIELKQKEAEEMDIPTRLVTQREAIVWRRVIVGNTIIEDKEAEFSDTWTSYPILPFRAYFTPVEIKEKGELQVQGLVRPMKEPQREKNVARTHARRHLLSSTNSGWLAEEGTIVNKRSVAAQGSKSGVIVEYKKGTLVKPERLTPVPLSSGFEFLSTQATEDLKMTSGINADLLSLDKGTDSGRAILLRQRQGLVMIQSLLDNLTQTTEQIGRFLVAVLPTIYTAERALKVLGEAFLMDAFGVDQKEQDPATGEEVTTGREIDRDAALAFVTKILNDKELVNYNISIGEGINSETVKFNNFLVLNELVKSGFPIPPDVLIDETGLVNATKEKIKNSFKQQAQQTQQA